MATYTIYTVPIRLYWDSYRAEGRITTQSSWINKTGTHNVINTRVGADGVTYYALASLIDGKTGIGWVRDDDNISNSTLSALPDFDIDKTCVISIDRQSSSMTHKLEFKIGNTVIRTVDNVDTSYSLTLSASEQNVVYSKMPNATSAAMSVVLSTYISDKQVGINLMYNFNVNIPSSVVPKFTTNPTVTIVNSVGGSAAKGKSQINIKGAVASPTPGASIVSYSVVSDYFTSDSLPYTSPIINQSGTIPIKVYAIDSRNRQTVYSTSVNVVDYKAIGINKLEATRTPTGIVFIVDGSHDAKLTKKPTFVAYLRVKGTTSWTQVLSGTTYGAATTAFVLNEFISKPNDSKVYELRLVFTDEFGNKTASELTVGTEEVPFSIGQFGVGVGLKVDNSGAHLQVGNKGINSLGPIRGTLGQALEVSTRAIENNTDLNTISEQGVYYNNANANVATFKNCPTSLAFMMEVISTSNGSSYGFVYQKITNYKDAVFIRSYYIYSKVWSAWKAVVS